jgi:hypothetical protein
MRKRAGLSVARMIGLSASFHMIDDDVNVELEDIRIPHQPRGYKYL